ncbi:hypothetical protein AMK68_04350, partial [candidate division KD3-62 bacterium DG_56]
TEPWRAGWQQYDPNLLLTDVWSLDVSDLAMPADVQIDEWGIAAVKDPNKSNLWLFWSSLRTPEQGTNGNPPEPTSDIFYEAFNPPMPDGLSAPEEQ